MNEWNNDTINHMIPQEIPIPHIDGNPETQNEPNRANGSPDIQNQPNRAYGGPYVQNQPHNTYAVPGQFYGQPVQPYQPRGRKKPGKAIIIAVCVAAVLILLGGSAWAYYTSRPLYKIAKGLQNLNREFDEMKNPLSDKIGTEELIRMMQEEGGHVETRMNFTVDTFLGSTTLGIDTDLYKDMRAKELDSSTAVSIMNYELAHLELYGNEDIICFSIPELFLEDMYFNTENVVSQYNHSILADDEMFGEADIEDFSITLFPEDEDRISIGEWRNLNAYMAKYDEAVAACRANMTVEKADKGAYRITCSAEDADRLIREIVESSGKLYEGQEEALEILRSYDRIVASDMSFLFAISNQNRIESIALEAPVELLDGKASLYGEIFFLGEERSIDTMQGKIEIVDVYGEETEMVCQIEQTLERDDYQIGMDLKYTADGASGKMKLTMDCDASEDTFAMTFSMKDDEDTLEITTEGELDDIVQGESFALDLEDFTVKMDGERLCTITGDVKVEPLTEKIEPGVEAKTALFEMTYSDITLIAYQLSEEYGSIISSLLGY